MSPRHRGALARREEACLQRLPSYGVIPRTVIPRMEILDKIPKLIPRINLGISSDLRKAIPEIYLRFIKLGIVCDTWSIRHEISDYLPS